MKTISIGLAAMALCTLAACAAPTTSVTLPPAPRLTDTPAPVVTVTLGPITTATTSRLSEAATATATATNIATKRSMVTATLVPATEEPLLSIGPACVRMGIDQAIQGKVNAGETLVIADYCGLGRASVTLLFSDTISSTEPASWSTRDWAPVDAGLFGVPINLLNLHNLTLKSRNVWSVVLGNGQTIVDASLTFVTAGGGGDGILVIRRYPN